MYYTYYIILCINRPWCVWLGGQRCVCLSRASSLKRRCRPYEGTLTPKRASIFTQNALRARRYRGPHEHFAGMPLTPNHKHSLDSAHAKTRGPNPSGTRHTSTARDRGLSTCARPVWPRVPTSEHACGRLSRPLRPLPSIPAWPGWPNSTTGRPPALLSPTPAGI